MQTIKLCNETHKHIYRRRAAGEVPLIIYDAVGCGRYQ